MKFVPLLIIFVLFASTVQAVGIASDYLEDKTIELAPGESRLWGVRVQNPDDAALYIRLNYEKEHMHLMSETDDHRIEPQSVKAFTFNITAPADVTQNTSYGLGVTLQQLSASGGGVPLNLNIAKAFTLKVVVVQEKTQPFPWTLILLMGFIFCIFVYLLHKRKKIVVHEPSENSPLSSTPTKKKKRRTKKP